MKTFLSIAAFVAIPAMIFGAFTWSNHRNNELTVEQCDSAAHHAVQKRGPVEYWDAWGQEIIIEVREDSEHAYRVTAISLGLDGKPGGDDIRVSASDVNWSRIGGGVAADMSKEAVKGWRDRWSKKGKWDDDRRIE